MKNFSKISDSISNNQEQKFSCEKLSDTLNKLLNENKISINQLHENTGVALATIKRIKYDKSANPTINSLLPIAEFFSITLNQLLGLEPFLEERAIGVYKEKKHFWKKIPVIEWEHVKNYSEKSKMTYTYDFVLTDIEASDETFALIVQEIDWALFSKGTKLIFDPNKASKHRHYVLISNKDVPIVSFYQILFFDGTAYLKPPQVEYKTIEFDKDKHSIKATMIQARMDQE